MMKLIDNYELIYQLNNKKKTQANCETFDHHLQLAVLIFSRIASHNRIVHHT